MSLKHGLLGLLTYDEMTGYDLKKTFDSSLQFMWNAKASQIYRELGKMEEEGMVLSRVEPQNRKFDRKVYTITTQGREAFQKWLGSFPADLEVPIRDPFIVRVFFGEYLPADQLAFEIRRFKKQRQEALDVLTGVMDAARQASREDGLEKAYDYWVLTIRKAQKEIQAEIEWADETIAELERGR